MSKNNSCVCRSNGVSWSKGVSTSDGVNGSDCVNKSDGVSLAKGVSASNGVNGSYGVGASNGVNKSDGVSWSNGVNRSFGVIGSFGVDSEIFCANRTRQHRVFGVVVCRERFEDVWRTLHEKLDGWRPSWNNALELYIKSGSDWDEVEASDICDYYLGENPWEGMPQEAIDYLKSLPEFDGELFKAVTGLDADSSKVQITCEGKTVEISRESAKALNLI